MTPDRPVTAAPVTYVMGTMDLKAPEQYIELAGAARPHVLHGGHDTSFDNSWGAFPGVESDDVKVFPALMSPDEVRQRSAAIRECIKQLHNAGVENVVPYICNQTLAGNPDTRAGVWEFYDHWDDYGDFDFGPKPEADPIDWMTRERNGRVHYNYEKRHPYFTRFDHYRFAPCQNNPFYHQYQRGIVTDLVKLGYDGTFVDNNSLNCYCDHCQREFHTYLSERYSPSRLRERFGVGDVSEISLGYRGSPSEWVKTDPDFLPFIRQSCTDEQLMSLFATTDLDEALIEDMGTFWLTTLAEQYRRDLETRLTPRELTAKFGSTDVSLWGIGTPEDRALWAETKRFRAQSIADNQAMVKAIGQSIREDFFIVPNFGPMQRIEGNGLRLMEQWGHAVAPWQPNIRFIMFEEFSDPGMIARGYYLDFVLQYKFGFASHVRPGVLCYVTRKDAAELAYAEAAAGGGGCYMHGHLDDSAYIQIEQKYRSFFKDHADLLDGYHSYADVAVAYCYDELHMENVEHIRQVQKLTRYLCDQHILFDFVREEDLAGDPLLRYRVVILPDVRFMSDAQIAGVERFVKAGGTAILTRETGCYDQDGRVRTPVGFSALLDGGARDENGLLTVKQGGTCVHSFDLSNLLPQDRLSRDDTFNCSVEGVDVPGQREYAAMARVDRDLVVDRYLAGGALLDCITAGLCYDPSVADPIKGVGVRFNAYMKTDGDKASLVLHAVNYNLPLVGEAENQNVIPVENLSVQLRMPSDWEIQEVRAIEPDVPPQALAFKAENGTSEFVLPTITFYKMVDISAAVQP